MVTGDGDRVELRHVLRGVFEDVGDDLHGELRRVDIGVTHHELLEDIVLDGTCHLLEFGSLLESGVDIEREDRQHGTVHGHGDGHLVQGDAGEEHFHILQRADGHTCFADVTYHAHVIGVIAAVGREVEGYGQTFLTGREVAAVEGVGLLCGGESCVLTDGPRTERIHGAVRATEERRNTGDVVEVLHALQVLFGVDRLDVDEFWRLPVGVVRTNNLAGRNLLDINLFEIWFHMQFTLSQKSFFSFFKSKIIKN